MLSVHVLEISFDPGARTADFPFCLRHARGDLAAVHWGLM